MLSPVESDTEREPKAGITWDPNIKFEDSEPRSEQSSTTNDSPETSMSPSSKSESPPTLPRKEKFKTLVRINPKPVVKVLRGFERSSSGPPTVPYDIPVKKYEWKRYFIREPLKSAMKRTKDKSPKDPSIFPLMPSPKVPNRRISLKQAVDVDKKPSRSRPVSLPQPDPSITQTLLSPERVSTPQSMKDTSSTLPHVPISTTDSVNILTDRLLPKLPKDTEASASPSVQPEDPEDKGISFPLDWEELLLLETKKSELSKPPTEPKIPSLIKKPPKSLQKHLKRSLTWLVLPETQLPPILPKHSTKRPSKDSSSMPPTQLPPVESCDTILTASPKEHGTLPLKFEKMSLGSPVQSSVLLEKVLKIPNKKAIKYKPVDIHIGSQYQVSVYVSI